MTFIIAEAGINHHGHVNTAAELCYQAKKSGADAVKFQLFDSVKLWGDDRIKHLELTHNDMRYLCQICTDIGIEFLCTPFGVEELEFLTPMVKRIKIASGCRKAGLIEAAYKTGLPVIVSTGMADLNELEWIVDSKPEDTDLTLLHCTSCYPCELEDVNLRAMMAIHNRYFCKVGYSDHTVDILAPVVAVALGACVIEKHFTLDRNADGPDHKTSLGPALFRQMVEDIRHTEILMGRGEKKVLSCEEKLRSEWYAE